MPRGNRLLLQATSAISPTAATVREFLLKFARDRQRRSTTTVMSADSRWVQALAVGSESVVTRFQLGVGGSNREIIQDSDSYRLGEPPKYYTGCCGVK